MQDLENKDEKDLTKDGKEGALARVYEVGYLLIPTIPEEDVPAVYSGLKDLIVSLGGSIVADEMPKSIPLAYPMLKVIANVRNKFSTAFFGWIKFDMNPEGVLTLKKKLDLDNNVIRFLMIKTVRENTIAGKRLMSKEGARRRSPAKRKEEDGEVMPIDEKEIDKEIEALVVE